MSASSDRLTAATAALIEMVSRWRDIPEYHETLVDLLLRVLMASPEWQEVRWALREIEKDNDCKERATRQRSPDG